MSTEDAPLPIAPKVLGPRPHILIVRAPYYQDVVNGLNDGVTRILSEAGASFETLDVAGALELPQAIRLVLTSGVHFDGFVALGCVVRGDTDHYEHVCREAMSGLMLVALRHALAVGNGLLTVSTLKQAQDRSGPDGHNKGAEAAMAVLMQVNAARRFVLDEGDL